MLGYDWPRLHAALNDLPAALLLIAVLFDLAAALARRPALRVIGFAVMLVGAVGGILAVVSGLQAEEHIAHGEAVHRIMETHETLALVTLGIFGVLALWRVFRERRMGATERGVTLALSLGGVGVLIATAVLGGRLVFEHAAGIPTEVLQEEMHERAEGHHHHGGEADEADHDHDADPTAPSSSAAPDSAEPAGHTHAPGTPPHQD
ncbi:MAG TPA: DUF2231 domain-containing protein [Gemmatimonadales bacterium]|nr:DUF2231 domain-containing protein [Gemmatimonadales bacterium]